MYTTEIPNYSEKIVSEYCFFYYYFITYKNTNR